ncbi:MAG: homoserine O-acetyltransferase MetA [Fastidiosipilaceae bacterium]|jgi:homoserine O-succinyltransferase|nr:homoserine O-succinyltransferase [Clostridiaceae bacterium]
MPIKLPEGLPAVEVFEREAIFYMPAERAFHQDIRPLHILMLNLMPTKVTTETQFFRLLGNTPLQVEPHLLYTASYKPTHTSPSHLARYYRTFDEIKERTFDGMIITGAPVELMRFEDVAYWEEICEIMEWAKTHVYSTMHVCWGAQAGLYYHFGVPKYALEKKMFGVFPHHITWNHPVKLFRGFDDVFYVPHSRYTEVRPVDILKNPKLRLLSMSEESGVFAVSDHEGRQFFVTGHVEYDPLTLKHEYDRDVAKGLPIHVPKNYYPNDDPTKEPIMRWRSSAYLMFANWLNYYVYQETPFNIDEIKHRK